MIDCNDETKRTPVVWIVYQQPETGPACRLAAFLNEDNARYYAAKIVGKRFGNLVGLDVVELHDAIPVSET